MLWLPKWLHDQGEHLEAAKPSRRAFLFMAAATVVAAVAPTPTWVGEDAYVGPDPFTKAWLEGPDAMRVLFAGGRRGGKTWAAYNYMKAECDKLAVDPAGVHGMVNHQGLIVPKYAPQSSWQSQFLGHFEPRWREPDYRGEFADASGKPAGWVKAADWVKAEPENPDAHAVTWRATRRRKW